MLNVTLKHYSTAFTDEIASRPSVNHQSHLYGSYALIMILFEQPFTFRIWKYVDARAKWGNVWRKTREFQVVRNPCLNQWHFPHARTVTWYKETHICKWTCCPHILGIRRYLYRIAFFHLDFLLLLQKSRGLQGYKWSCFPLQRYLLIGVLPFRASSPKRHY